MDETKNVLQSKTVWGAIISVVGVVMGLVGFDTGALNGLEETIVVLVGAVLSVYGRVKAVKKIG